MEKSANKNFILFSIENKDFKTQIEKTKKIKLNKIDLQELKKEELKNEEKNIEILNDINKSLSLIINQINILEFISQGVVKENLKSEQKKDDLIKIENFNIIQNKYFYEKLLNKFFIHPCFIFKLLVRSECKDIFDGKLLKLFLSKFTSNKQHYNSYLFSLLILFLKHEWSTLINDSVENVDVSIFVKIYSKIFKNETRNNKFYLNLKNFFFSKLKLLFKSVSSSHIDLDFNKNEKLKKKCLLIYSELLNHFFVINNLENFTNDYLNSVHQKIYKIIKKNFKIKNGIDILCQSAKERIKIYIAKLFLNGFFSSIKNDIKKAKNNFFSHDLINFNLDKFVEDSFINFFYYIKSVL